MEKQLLEMMKTASNSGVVVSRRFGDSMQLLVYPLEQRQGVLIGIGYGAENAHRVNMDDVLRRRTQDVARFGPWLPAVFNDGSHFVIRRVGKAELEESMADNLVSGIHTAQELLS